MFGRNIKAPAQPYPDLTSVPSSSIDVDRLRVSHFVPIAAPPPVVLAGDRVAAVVEGTWMLAKVYSVGSSVRLDFDNKMTENSTLAFWTNAATYRMRWLHVSRVPAVEPEETGKEKRRKTSTGIAD